MGGRRGRDRFLHGGSRSGDGGGSRRAWHADRDRHDGMAGARSGRPRHRHGHRRRRRARRGPLDHRQARLVHDGRRSRSGGAIMRRAFTGCGTALVTPFKKDGSLDDAGVTRLAKRQIDAGIHFLVPCGTTGEVPTLTDVEQVRVVELVAAEAKGRVPVLAGAGGYNTHEVIEAGKRMKAAGADGLLSVTPYYNKPTPEGLYQHYKAIAEGVGLPIV